MVKKKYPIWIILISVFILFIFGVNFNSEPQTMAEYSKIKTAQNDNELLNLQAIGDLPQNPQVHPVYVLSVQSNKEEYVNGQSIILNTKMRFFNPKDTFNLLGKYDYVIQGGLLSEEGDYIDGEGNLMAIFVQENLCDNNMNRHYANREITIDFDGEDYKDLEIDFSVLPRKPGSYVYFANAQNYCYYQVPNGEEYEGYGYKLGSDLIVYGDDADIGYFCPTPGVKEACVIAEGKTGERKCGVDNKWGVCVADKKEGSGCSRNR